MAEVDRFRDQMFVLRLSRQELNLVRSCLLEAWEALSDQDFVARTGFEASAVIELRRELTDQGKRALAESAPGPGDEASESDG